MSGESAATSLQASYDAHKEADELRGLPVQATIDKAKADENEVRKLVADVSNWTLPCETRDKEKAVRAALQTFEDSCGCLRDYADHIAEVADRAAKEFAKLKKDWRNARDKLRKMLVSKGLPRAVAKCASTAWQASASDPASAGVDYLKYSLEFSVQPDKPRESLQQPALITKVGPHLRTHWLDS